MYGAHPKACQNFVHPLITISLFIWETGLGKGSFRIKVLTLVQLITENRLMHARGPVHLHRVRYVDWLILEALTTLCA